MSSTPTPENLAGYTFYPKTPTDDERDAIVGVAQNAWDQIAQPMVARLVGHFLIQPVFRIYTEAGVEDHTLNWGSDGMTIAEMQAMKVAEMERMRDRIERIGKKAHFAALVAHTRLETPSSMFSTAPAQPQLGAIHVQVESAVGCLLVSSAQYHWPAGLPPYLDAPKYDVYHDDRKYVGPLAGFFRRHLTAMSRH